MKVASYLPTHDELVHSVSSLYREDTSVLFGMGLRTAAMEFDERCVLADLSMIDHRGALQKAGIMNEFSRPDLVAEKMLTTGNIDRFVFQGIYGSPEWGNVDSEVASVLNVALMLVGYTMQYIDDLDEDDFEEFYGAELMEACKYDVVLKKYSEFFCGNDLPDYEAVIHGRSFERMVELIGRRDEAEYWFGEL